jgi:hypothetical protein
MLLSGGGGGDESRPHGIGQLLKKTPNPVRQKL